MALRAGSKALPPPAPTARSHEYSLNCQVGREGSENRSLPNEKERQKCAFQNTQDSARKALPNPDDSKRNRGQDNGRLIRIARMIE